MSLVCQEGHRVDPRRRQDEGLIAGTPLAQSACRTLRTRFLITFQQLTTCTAEAKLYAAYARPLYVKDGAQADCDALHTALKPKPRELGLATGSDWRHLKP